MAHTATNHDYGMPPFEVWADTNSAREQAAVDYFLGARLKKIIGAVHGETIVSR